MAPASSSTSSTSSSVSSPPTPAPTQTSLSWLRAAPGKPTAHCKLDDETNVLGTFARNQRINAPTNAGEDEAVRPSLTRAQSDIGPRGTEKSLETPSPSMKESTSSLWEVRHGWDTQLTSPDRTEFLKDNFFMYYAHKLHETCGNPTAEKWPLQEWRMRDRLKTVTAVLALCLNIGVDPPDVIKTSPCARLECWVDPANLIVAPGHTPLNQIGKALQTQYEQLSMRTRYKLCLDPSLEELKKYCMTSRKTAKEERVLFHYNGHGVPKPTSSAEIWVFNRNYTQYIPVSLYDLQGWLAAPSLFVWDCANAGIIIKNFGRFVERHEAENEEMRTQDPNVQLLQFADCIHLAACSQGESLPSNPSLPADLFTSCLTTPIEMALRFFILQNPLPSHLTVHDATTIPGRVSERRTPIGELNWIFTAITDTIAWNSLSKTLFKKLFRQDLMVAALFRNFLLAQRIMRLYHCRPQCYPEIPQTHNHSLWGSWDLAVEMILNQIPDLLAAERGEKIYEYQHSTFFEEQLTAFEVYLAEAAVDKTVPEQLPIVLQVLLSQVHRLRALILLSKFLDLGPWAVNLALSIGIFPYVLKLLQSQAMELKPVMVFIWARILAVDQSCQYDLLKDNGYQYFISILNPSFNPPIANASDHRAMCAFIVAMFCKDFHQGQVVALGPGLVESCLSNLENMQNPLLRQWSCLCLSMLWINHPEAKWVGIRCSAHQRLCELVLDPVPEVRAAMLHALTTFLGIPDLTDQVACTEASVAANLLIVANDGSCMVRKEFLVFFSTFVARYENKFVVAAYEQMVAESRVYRVSSEESLDKDFDALHIRSRTEALRRPAEEAQYTYSRNSIFPAIWKQLLILSVDPYPEVAQDAAAIVDHVVNALMSSPLGAAAESLIASILPSKDNSITSVRSRNYPSTSAATFNTNSAHKQNGSLSTADHYFPTAVIKRTASVASSLRNLAFGISTSNLEMTTNQASKRAPVNRTVQSLRAAPSRASLPSEWVRPPDDRDQHTLNNYQSATFPLPRYFESSSSPSERSMPLRSRFFEWASEYFKEPQMKQNEAEEPGSSDYNDRLWRRNRNEGIFSETQPLKEVAGSSQWNRPSGMFNNGGQPMKLCFHQFENQLVVTDDKDIVSVWDWKQPQKLNRFSNGNPAGSKITEARFINEDDQALLMIGSSDGVIKVFRNYDSSKKVELVTALRTLTDLVPSNKGAGLVFDWQQGQGIVLVAGDLKVIRVWNAGTEICMSDIPARSGSCVTSLTSDQVEGNVFVAGFGDGAVRVYDQRLKPATAMVKIWKEHRQWVTNVHLQRGGRRELVSGCRSGEVKLWDIRLDRSVNTTAVTKDTLRTLSTHEHAPVICAGSERHLVKTFNTDGHFLSACEPFSSFLHQSRSSPVCATAFHPHRMMLACSALNDPHISLFGMREAGIRVDGDIARRNGA